MDQFPSASVVLGDPLDAAVHACARAAEVVAGGGGMHLVHQPIVELDAGAIVGYEALARFEGVASTQDVFEGGHLLGLGPELEARVLERALEATRRLARGWRLHINVSPSVLTSPRVRAILEHARLERLVIELTERAPAREVASLEAALLALRARGALIAVDDAGSGFGGLDLLLGVGPDIVKLDPVMIRDLADHVGRAGVVQTIVETAHAAGALVIAEGIEDAVTLEACVRLGIDAAQGYWLARPGVGFPDVPRERLMGVVRAERRVRFGPELARRLAPARFVPASASAGGGGVRVGIDALGRAVWVSAPGRGPLEATEVSVAQGWPAVRAALLDVAEAVVVVDDDQRALGVVLRSAVVEWNAP